LPWQSCLPMQSFGMRVVALVALVACGRVDFGVLGAASDAHGDGTRTGDAAPTGDAAGDAAGACANVTFTDPFDGPFLGGAWGMYVQGNGCNDNGTFPNGTISVGFSAASPAGCEFGYAATAGDVHGACAI